MDFKDIQEIKDFLVWAKDEKIVHIEVNGVKAVFSPAAFLPKSLMMDSNANRPVEDLEEQLKREYEEILYASAR